LPLLLLRPELEPVPELTVREPPEEPEDAELPEPELLPPPELMARPEPPPRLKARRCLAAAWSLEFSRGLWTRFSSLT